MIRPNVPTHAHAYTSAREQSLPSTHISRGDLPLDVIRLGRHAEGRRRRRVGAAGGGGGGQLALEGRAWSAADREGGGRGDACCGDGEGGLELHGCGRLVGMLLLDRMRSKRRSKRRRAWCVVVSSPPWSRRFGGCASLILQPHTCHVIITPACHPPRPPPQRSCTSTTAAIRRR